MNYGSDDQAGRDDVGQTGKNDGTTGGEDTLSIGAIRSLFGVIAFFILFTFAHLRKMVASEDIDHEKNEKRDHDNVDKCCHMVSW
jgi:hypothetical protein